MHLKPEDISIGVTVYRRLDYLEAALDSAVNQTVPVKVRLYDDGCQDMARMNHILERFGDRVEYRKNPRSLGLFGNMNACIWNSPTPWVSVLHDDDQVAKDFVERILEAAPEVNSCALFCGGTIYLTPDGRPFHAVELPPGIRWRRISPEEFAWKNWFPFPGQLMHVETAKAAGGFPTKSIYTGDWELWFRLALAGNGVTQLAAKLGLHRIHLGGDRGTTAAAKSGRRTACAGMQVKRNLARLRERGIPAKFDRRRWLEDTQPLYRNLLVYSWGMPRWLLRYNRRLLLMTAQTGRASRILQFASRTCGVSALRVAGLATTLASKLGLRTPQTF